ncbi:ATP-binding protein [Geobacter sp. SVR]|uniref:ATP-binding protein n=1 Tax=Geobacter sp. SVR TaxID=2495594 RepID=UPI00143EFD3E|nr:ATP-binding protein [Geobacter sp. SVR]BCS55920.1 two-component sensor histidine kinase [Geobacter sp. SVR]GCF84683.1 two-component sensor histidine kinase [Geobacter sp. SVR]
MHVGVRYKLFLAILTAASLAVVSSALITKWSIDRGFLKFINAMDQSGLTRLAGMLEERYRSEQSWDFLRNDPTQWQALIVRSLPEGAPLPALPFVEGAAAPSHNKMPPPFMRQKPPHASHHFEARLFLLDAERRTVAGTASVPAGNPAIPIMHQGRVAGYLGLLPRSNLAEMPHQRFLKEQKQGLALQAAVITLLSALLSLFMAKRLVRPLNELAQATHQLAAGRFAVRVPVGSHDEFGQLAMDFNSLALSLEQSERSRQQWVADISHELRTPLAILRGEIEALQDGIRHPDRETIRSLHSEVLRLGRLVDDLYQLSLSDVGALTYRKQHLNLVSLLEEAVAAYRAGFHAKEVEIGTEFSAGGEVIFGDRERLRQLFSNLLDNSLKYTDSGGSVRMTLQRHEDRIVIELADSAPGVPQSELERLFDRLYRVESSRSRATGGAGLGLAICRNIVQAHGGEIIAQASPLGGVSIRIELPRAWE